jgi:hypothetical protein
MAGAGTYSSRRLNTLIKTLGFTRYLEIGVYTGATFLQVSAEHRTGVDPNFRFEFEKHKNPATRFFSMTSDEYFLRLAPNDMFDVFFVDGLHTFEQTFRDFCCSLSCAHSRSIWLIDDTVPNDPYSALPNHGDAMRFRAETGSSDLSWHGDVYKTVFAIHDFFPMLSYCTINTGGNPQTLVWKQSRGTAFAPKFNSLEAISRLSFFDFKKNVALMKYCDEATGLGLAINSQRQPEAGAHQSG